MTDALIEKVAGAICLAAWDYDYTPRDPLHPDTRWVQATRAARAAILAVLDHFSEPGTFSIAMRQAVDLDPESFWFKFAAAMRAARDEVSRG